MQLLIEKMTSREGEIEEKTSSGSGYGEVVVDEVVVDEVVVDESPFHVEIPRLPGCAKDLICSFCDILGSVKGLSHLFEIPNGKGLVYAGIFGKSDYIEMCIKNEEIIKIDMIYYIISFEYASKNCYTECVRLLTNYMDKIMNIGTIYVFNILRHAVKYNHNEFVKLYIKYIDKAFSHRFIYIATEYNNIECLNMFIMIHSDKIYNTSLYVAAKYNYYECFKILFPHSVEYYGVIILASNYGYSDIIPDILLLINDNEDMSTPLFVASKSGHVECVNIFLKLGGLNHFNENDDRSFKIAATYGNHECVKALLPYVKLNKNKTTALNSAVKHGHYECVKLLIEYILSKKHKKKLLRIATGKKYIDCIKLLK